MLFVHAPPQIHIKGVHLRICGQAKTSWSESKTKFVNGKTKTADVFYQAHETYLDARTYLKTDGGGGGGGGADGGNFFVQRKSIHAQHHIFSS